MSECLNKKFPEDPKPIPSEEWHRLQLWPISQQCPMVHWLIPGQVCSTSLPTRRERKSHQDSRCVAEIFHYVKHFVVSLRDQSFVLSVDDKATVPVGEPGNLISSGVDVIIVHCFLQPLVGPACWHLRPWHPLVWPNSHRNTSY